MKNRLKDLLKDVNEKRDEVNPIILSWFFQKQFLSIKPLFMPMKVQLFLQ
jgi:hypothetical protein